MKKGCYLVVLLLSVFGCKEDFTTTPANAPVNNMQGARTSGDGDNTNPSNEDSILPVSILNFSKGYALVMEYNDNNQLSAIAYFYNNEQQPSITYEFVYNEDGRLITVLHYSNEDLLTSTDNYIYDEGKLISRTETYGDSTLIRTDFSYNSENKVVEMLDYQESSDGAMIIYQRTTNDYDANGNISEQHRYAVLSGVEELIEDITFTYDDHPSMFASHPTFLGFALFGFNNPNNLVRQESISNTGYVSFVNYGYSYNGLGHPTSVIIETEAGIDETYDIVY